MSLTFFFEFSTKILPLFYVGRIVDHHFIAIFSWSSPRCPKVRPGTVNFFLLIEFLVSGPAVLVSYILLEQREDLWNQLIVYGTDHLIINILPGI